MSDRFFGMNDEIRNLPYNERAELLDKLKLAQMEFARQNPNSTPMTEQEAYADVWEKMKGEKWKGKKIPTLVVGSRDLSPRHRREPKRDEDYIDLTPDIE